MNAGENDLLAEYVSNEYVARVITCVNVIFVTMLGGSLRSKYVSDAVIN